MKVNYPNLVGEPLDYSKGKNWMFRQDNGDCKVDVFYLYPTAVSIKCKDAVSPVDQHMKFAALGNFERGPSCFDGFCNIFAPYYRQLSVMPIVQSKHAGEFYMNIYESEVRTDAYAALDYYFEHYNQGRPFILASHSQGSATMYNVLREYMLLHPDYYQRMIAAYVLGMAVTKKFQEAYPHIKFAKGELDTGVVISWNVEGPNATMPNFPVVQDAADCIINPLNWKTDDTYAPIEANKGSYDLKTHSVIPGVCDAQINVERKVLICTGLEEKGYKPIPKEAKLFGDQSYHFDDWNFFYENIKENAQKRIEQYFKNHK